MKLKLSQSDYKKVLDIVYDLSIKEANKVISAYEEYVKDIFLCLTEEENYGLEVELSHYGAYRQEDLPAGYDSYYVKKVYALGFTVQIMFHRDSHLENFRLCQLSILDDKDSIQAIYSFNN